MGTSHLILFLVFISIQILQTNSFSDSNDDYVCDSDYNDACPSPTDKDTFPKSRTSTTKRPTGRTTSRPTDRDESQPAPVASDPFYQNRGAEQLTCTSAGVNCTTCPYVDWLKIYNKTIDPSAPVYLSYSNVDEPTCFLNCNATPSCTAFTLNKQDGTCKIYSAVNFGSTINSSDYSMYIRLAPRWRFLSEWLITLDFVPRGLPLKSFEPRNVTNFLNCTIFCASYEGCVFATLNRTDMICTLYPASSTFEFSLRGNTIAISHISLLRPDSLWRFNHLGPIYQNIADQPEPYGVQSVEECLEDCNNQTDCQLATTTAYSEGVVDCYLYNFYQNIWFTDNPPNNANNSFYKAVQKRNSLYKKLPHYEMIHNSSIPFYSGEKIGIIACHYAAIKSYKAFHYSYNSSTGICSLYNMSVVMQSYRRYDKYDLATFDKTIPTNYLPYYAFDSFWAEANVLVDNNTIPNQASGKDCLGKCLERNQCGGVAIQWPQGNCTLYKWDGLKGVVRNHNTSSDEGVQPVQVFIKSANPNVLLARMNYQCQQKSSITWRDINQFLQFGSLDDFRGKIPVGNNDNLEPHGPAFAGQGEGTGGEGTDGVGEEGQRRKSCGGDNSTAFKAKVKDIDDYFDLDDIPITRDVPLPPEAIEMAPRIFTKTGQMFGPIAAGVEEALGEAGGVIGGVAGAAEGGVAGARVGYQLGELAGRAAAVIGILAFEALVSVALNLGTSSFKCWFHKCDQDKEEPLECNDRCFARSIDQFWSAVRATNCKCTTDPHVNEDAGIATTYPDHLVEPCKDKKRVGQYCELCCTVMYEAEHTPQCICVSINPIWAPDRVKCVGKINCQEDFISNIGSLGLPVTKMQSCREQLYYILVFNKFKKIPFFTIYAFGSDNKNNPGLKDVNFVNNPCRSFKSQQTAASWYSKANKAFPRLNPDKPNDHNKKYNWDKGHLAPNADIRWSKDAQRSTYYVTNCAPQDHYANSALWGTLEDQIRSALSEDITIGGESQQRKGYIITGTCLDTDSSPIPSCYWKLVCTRDDSGGWTVAGFWHKNVLSTTDEMKAERRKEVYQIRDQESMPPLGFSPVKDVWEEAGNYFDEIEDRERMIDCYNAGKINFPPDVGVKPRAEGDYALYDFWNNKIFGGDFAERHRKNEEESLFTTEEGIGSVSGNPPSCGKRVVGYITGWSDVKFSPSAATYLTHVIFAFVEMTGDGRLQVGSADQEGSKDISLDTKKSYLRLYEIKNAKQRSGGRLKTIFAVGGWANSQYFSRVAGNNEMTQNFIKTGIEILDYFNMDGIDVDWEYPVSGGANVGVKQDRENYISFLSSIKSALAGHQRARGRLEPYTLSIAGAAGSWVLDDGYDLPKIAEIVDWINVMTYDYNGAWDSKWGAYTGPHSPLYFGAPQGYSGKTNVDYTLKYYSCRIKDRRKLTMGLGFYGRFWNNSGSRVDPSDPVWRKASANAQGKFDGGFEPYRNIVKNYLRNPEYQKGYHHKTQTPYLESSSGFFMGYEDSQSITEKVRYAAAKGFGGVMMWAVDLDDNQNTLIRLASSEMLCSGSNDISFDYKCPPVQEQRWWTLLDDENKGGMCGKSAPLYKGFYPVCDPEDPGYGCCSASGWCGGGDKFCKCDGCVDYYENPNKMLDEPVKPSGPVRWHTMDKFEPGPQCGYEGHRLENGEIAICNPDDNNGFCCSNAGYCGKTKEFCECEGCINFKQNPNYRYPEKTWIDSGPNAGRCGDGYEVNGKKATCNPNSKEYYCCSAGGYCGSTKDHCDCNGCVNYKN